MFDKKDKCLYIRGCGNDNTIYILRPCPVCCKKPKVKIDYSSEDSGFGGYVRIRCRSLFFKRHNVCVEKVKSTNERALRSAADLWNHKVSLYDKSPVYEEEV